MATRSFKPNRRRGKRPETTRPSLETIVREAEAARATRAQSYRERSLAIHGWICGRCAREFEVETLHLLTVHHRDGNHHNNPPDGSNWENLCAYCHEAEHTAGLLGDYLSGRDSDRKRGG